ncbi:MAG: phosphonate ABC transporter, permease protein PhnE [Sideroxydans sp.]|nr:phosphonate ABC transporter, permease protein PhnE [Sideroxydans sp.]
MNNLSVNRDAKWHLNQPYNARHLVIAILAFILLAVTGSRMEVPRMVSETAQGLGYVVGLNEESAVATGVKRIAASIWPLRISEEIEVSRIEGFDPNKLPWLSHVEVIETRTPHLNTDTLQLEETIEHKEVLVKPLGYLMHVLLKMLETLEMALWGTLLAVVLSIPLACFAASNYAPNRFVYNLSRSTISLFRAIPELVSALFLVLAFGFGPIAGFLALGIHSAGFLGKFYAEDIENADRGPQEALQSIGAGQVKTLWYGVLPQVLPQYIAYTLYILDRNIRMATVIGIVGAGGIGLELKGRFDMFNFDHVGTILLIIFLTVIVLDQFSARLRSRLM